MHDLGPVSRLRTTSLIGGLVIGNYLGFGACDLGFPSTRGTACHARCSIQELKRKNINLNRRQDVKTKEKYQKTGSEGR